jgi:DNA polymerase III sliding clamp (beta) subunit (PCNA family)
MIKPHIFCGNNTYHPALSFVAINTGKDKGYLFATDTHILIKAKVDECLPDCVADLLTGPCFILGKDFAQLQNLSVAEMITVRGQEYISGMVIPKKGSRAKDVKEVFVKVVKTPDWKWPDCDAAIERVPENKAITRIGVNATLLNRVQQAIGSPSIHLYFSAENNAIGVRDGKSDDRFTAICMPTTIF